MPKSKIFDPGSDCDLSHWLCGDVLLSHGVEATVFLPKFIQACYN